MDFIKKVCMVYGAGVLLFSALGALNIGHFRMYYGPNASGCQAMEQRSAEGAKE